MAVFFCILPPYKSRDKKYGIYKITFFIPRILIIFTKSLLCLFKGPTSKAADWPKTGN